MVYGVGFHETIHLRCDVDANPSEVTFYWKLHSSHQMDLVTFNQFNASSILTYSPQMQQDYGSIECSAKNSVGIQQKPCVFRIVPAGPPTFPFHCTPSNASKNSLSISCVYQAWPSEEVIGPSDSPSDNYVDVQQMPDSTTSKPPLGFPHALYVHPSTFYVCEVYSGSQLITNQSVALPLPYPNSLYCKLKILINLSFINH